MGASKELMLYNAMNAAEDEFLRLRDAKSDGCLVGKDWPEILAYEEAMDLAYRAYQKARQEYYDYDSGAEEECAAAEVEKTELQRMTIELYFDRALTEEEQRRVQIDCIEALEDRGYLKPDINWDLLEDFRQFPVESYINCTYEEGELDEF